MSIGVHTTGRWDLNRGVHHTDHMVGYLNKWFSEQKESNQIEEEDILKKIKELSKSDEEKEYLISNIHVIREYPRENTRAYLGFMLHTFRSRR